MADNFNSDDIGSETQEIISETTDFSTFQDSVNTKDDNLVAISENSNKLNMAISENQEFGNTQLVADDDESTKKDGFLDENLVAISENSNKLNVAISEIQEFGNIQLVDDEESIKKYGFLDRNKGSSLNLEKNLVGVSENSKKLNVAISENFVVIPENSQEFGNTHMAKVKDNGKKDGLLNGEKGKSLNLEDKCRLTIEVIDDTAMIDISQLGKTFVNTMKKKRAYSRKELEDMRYIGMEQQKKTWVEVYCGLSDVVRKEYDGLLHQSNNKQKAPRRHRGKESTPNVISGDLVAKERGKHLKVYSQRSMTYGNLQRTLWLPVH